MKQRWGKRPWRGREGNKHGCRHEAAEQSMDRRCVKSQQTNTQAAALHAFHATQAGVEVCEQPRDAEVPTGRGSLGTGPGKECHWKN